MKKGIYLFVFGLFVLGCSSNPEPMDEVVRRALNVAVRQSVSMAEELGDQVERLPRSFNEHSGELVTSSSSWWCSGFFPGVLWYLLDYSGQSELIGWAEHYSARVEKEKFNTYDHDIGFQIYCSFGNGYRLTKRDDYKEVLLVAANSALERYDSNIGLIRSWDSHSDKWQYPVIIDNLMNLELLMWAFHNSGDSIFYEVATSHADLTMAYHYRPDFSSYHVVAYDTLTGQPYAKQTHQGAFDASIWSRGQAWGLYGYTMMYRETGYQRYLDLARGIADLLINHPNMPSDKVPYWDYLAEDVPHALRDASAAAIMASALIELSGFVDVDLKSKYLGVAETQLRTLSSSAYLAEPGSNGNFILKHSVGNFPRGSEVDVPLTYADYYYVEALVRYLNL